jgi:hypothetical protein
LDGSKRRIVDGKDGNNGNNDGSSVDGQLKLQELGNAVINVAAPGHSCADLSTRTRRYGEGLPLTKLIKLSSVIIMSDDSRATPVPERPMENPTSASASAGPSLVPSPVTATTSPK